MNRRELIVGAGVVALSGVAFARHKPTLAEKIQLNRDYEILHVDPAKPAIQHVERIISLYRCTGMNCLNVSCKTCNNDSWLKVNRALMEAWPELFPDAYQAEAPTFVYWDDDLADDPQKHTGTVQSRMLDYTYSMILAHDLKAISNSGMNEDGFDADEELTKAVIEACSTEILIKQGELASRGERMVSYIPLTMTKDVDPETYQLMVGFKTRYAVVPEGARLMTGSTACGHDSCEGMACYKPEERVIRYKV